jgi:hypothetical protein
VNVTSKVGTILLLTILTVNVVVEYKGSPSSIFTVIKWVSPLYAEEGGYIEIEVGEGCEKIGVGNELTVPLKVEVSSTEIGFLSSSIM